MSAMCCIGIILCANLGDRFCLWISQTCLELTDDWAWMTLGELEEAYCGHLLFVPMGGRTVISCNSSIGMA